MTSDNPTKTLIRGVAEPVTHPGGSVCAQKRSPASLHMDAAWTTPKALCNIEAPIHPDDITNDQEKVTCRECLSILSWLAKDGR